MVTNRTVTILRVLAVFNIGLNDAKKSCPKYHNNSMVPCGLFDGCDLRREKISAI